jgi:hypothetical protein
MLGGHVDTRPDYAPLLGLPAHDTLFSTFYYSPLFLGQDLFIIESY